MSIKEKTDFTLKETVEKAVIWVPIHKASPKTKRAMGRKSGLFKPLVPEGSISDARGNKPYISCHFLWRGRS